MIRGSKYNNRKLTPHGKIGARTKSQRTKSQLDKIPTDKIPITGFRFVWVSRLSCFVHACMVRSHGSCIHTCYHHAELLDAPYNSMLLWFILLLTETLILTNWCQSGICVALNQHLQDSINCFHLCSTMQLILTLPFRPLPSWKYIFSPSALCIIFSGHIHPIDLNPIDVSFEFRL